MTLDPRSIWEVAGCLKSGWQMTQKDGLLTLGLKLASFNLVLGWLGITQEVAPGMTRGISQTYTLAASTSIEDTMVILNDLLDRDAVE